MIDRIIATLLHKMHITISQTKQASINQFIKFCIVGITNVAVSYVLNVITLLALAPLKLSWDYVVGNIVSFLLSVLWSFYWNNRFVFKQGNIHNNNLLERLIKTYLSYSFSCIILNNIFSWFLIHVLDISKFISPLMVSCITIPVNFVLNKFWAYKK